MGNRIDIDHTHAWAICREVGKRLRAYLREDAELPASLRKQIDRLREATRLAYMTDEAVEGRDAFLQKRDPDWARFPYYY